MDHRTFIVNGIVKKYVGNQMNYKLINPKNKEPYKLIAIEGVYRHEGNPDFAISCLNSFYKIFNTNKNGEKFFVRSGQSVSVNLIVRDKRIISILTDAIDKAIDSLRGIKS